MPALRVLYDVSTLGVGHVAVQGRSGGHRVDRRLTELLAASPDCELLLCANQSSLAWQGCADYLREHPALADVPLLEPPSSPLLRGLRSFVVSAHRRVKIQRAGRALPGLLRSSGAMLDARVHRPVTDASPPVDVFHSSTTPLPPRAREGHGPRRFVTIFDLRAARPDASPHEIAHEEAVIASVRDGDGVFTSSDSTRAELCDRGIAPPGRIFVVPLAADPIFRPGTGGSDAAADAAARLALGVPDAPYVLMLDAAHPRKNLARAIEAFAALVQQQRIADLRLVLTGGSAPAAAAAAIEARHPCLRGRVVRTGYVGDADLAVLYRGARCFVYPSLYEGFGLPPLEAMQCGTPVITSNTSSLPEVVGDAGLMVDPTDVEALAAAMLARCGDDPARAAARDRGLEQSARFSWPRTLAATLDAYRAHAR